MSRQMRKGDSVVTVYSHGMTRNGWEYFLLQPKADSSGNVLALVMGDETEMGDVNIPEIAPYLLHFSKNLTDLMPCEGWEWVD